MELINFELDAISSTEPLDEIVQQRCLVDVQFEAQVSVDRLIRGYMSIFRRFVIPTWEIRLNKLNKLKLNKLIAMSE